MGTPLYCRPRRSEDRITYPTQQADLYPVRPDKEKWTPKLRIQITEEIRRLTGVPCYQAPFEELPMWQQQLLG